MQDMQDYYIKLQGMTYEELIKEQEMWEFSMRNSIDSMFSYSSGSEFQDAINRMQKRLDLIEGVIATGQYQRTPRN